MSEPSDACVVEARGRTIGMVVRHRRGYRFYASDRRFAAMEAALFRRPADAERAAELLLQTLRAEEAQPEPKPPLHA